MPTFTLLAAPHQQAAWGVLSRTTCSLLFEFSCSGQPLTFPLACFEWFLLMSLVHFGKPLFPSILALGTTVHAFLYSTASILNLYRLVVFLCSDCSKVLCVHSVLSSHSHLNNQKNFCFTSLSILSFSSAFFTLEFGNFCNTKPVC